MNQSQPELFFFFKGWRWWWISAGAHQLHSLSQYQSTEGPRTKMTVAERSLPCKLVSHTMPAQHNQPTPTSLGQERVRVYV